MLDPRLEQEYIQLQAKLHQNCTIYDAFYGCALCSDKTKQQCRKNRQRFEQLRRLKYPSPDYREDEE